MKRHPAEKRIRQRSICGLLCLGLLSCLLCSCAGNSPALSFGVGSHGAGFGLHSGFGDGYYWPGFAHGWFGRSHGGVMVGIPAGSPEPESDIPAPQAEPASQAEPAPETR